MNTSQHAVDKAMAGLQATGRAMMSIANAGAPNAGPDIVDTERLAFDAHIQEARAQFAEYFAELAANHPVTPEREKQEAAARVDPAPVTHDEAVHHTFLGMRID